MATMVRRTRLIITSQCIACLVITEKHMTTKYSGVVRAFAQYSWGIWFDAQQAIRLFTLHSWFSSVRSGKCCSDTLNYTISVTLEVLNSIFSSHSASQSYPLDKPELT